MNKYTKLIGRVVAFIGVLSFVVVPAVSFAEQSSREQQRMQEEIARLMDQLTNLRVQVQSAQAAAGAQVNTTNSAAGSEQINHIFNTNLTMGATGSDVTALQQFLISGGYLQWPAGVSLGQFENLTRSALVRYQKANAIFPASGYFGPLTRTRVNAHISAQVPFGSLSITAPLRNDYWQPHTPQKITWNTTGPIDTVTLSVAQVPGECDSANVTPCPAVDTTPVVIAENIQNNGEFQWENPSETLELGNRYAVSLAGFGKNNQGVQVKIASATSGAFLVSTSTEPRLTTTGNLTDARQNVWYSQIINTEGFDSRLRWSVSSGTLPVGLSVGRNTAVCPEGNTATCALSETFQGVVAGTPTVPGTYEFSLMASDGEHTAKKRFTLVVRP